MRYLTISLAMVCVIVQVSARTAPAATRYVVNAIKARGGLAASLGKAVTNQICTDLAKSARDAEVLCPDDIKAMLQARGNMLALGGEDDGSALASQAAMLAGADRGISGTLSKLGSSAMLQLKLMDYKQGKVLARATISADADNAKALLAKIPDALIELFKTLKKK